MSTESKAPTPPPEIFAEELAFTADLPDAGQRLDGFLARRMRWRSRTSIQRLIEDGKIDVTRRGERRTVRKPSSVLVGGDSIHVELPRPRRDVDFGEEGPPPDPDLTVLYEDRWLLAVDKPPNVAVHPAGRNLYRTVITTLMRRYRRPDDPARDVVPKLCHRLDLETSGVLLVAKEDQAHRRVSEMFRERAPEKEYLAIVHGTPGRRRDLIDLPIGPALARRVAIAKGIRHDVGQPAQTRYEVVETHGRFSLLRLALLTGRHHQIRVHCAAIGHPLVGDKIYGADDDVFIKYYDGALTPEDEAKLLLPRQALHAHRLKIEHPVTGVPLEFIAPLPRDLREFLDRAAEVAP